MYQPIGFLSTNFRDLKKGVTAPKIMESYIEDDGELWHILENGNSISDNIYSSIWNVPKGEIKPKGTKDEKPLTFRY